MNTKLKSLPGIGCLALKLLLTGCLATAAQGAGVFASTGSLNTAREEHTATLLPNGKVLVAAGYDGYSWVSSDLLASAELYDPSTGNWSPTGSLNTARSGHTATLLPSGQALIVGGYNIDAYSNAVQLASAELYDPATGIWTPTGNLTDARHYHTATLLPNGQVLVAGGLDEFGISASAELYDPATGVWTPTGSLTDVRVNHTATLLPNGLVLVAGGEDNDDYLASAELYDPATGIWSPTGSLGAARDTHTATLLLNGQALVAGGEDDDGLLASAELYDPATGIWSPTGSLGIARENHTATLLPNGQALVAGGFADTNDFSLSEAELYNPATGVWTPTGSLGSARYSDTATLLPNGQALIAGGEAFDGGTTAYAELYDPGLSFPSLVKLDDGSFQFVFINGSGPGYGVLASPNLAAPINSWKYLGPAIETPPGSGQFQFTDPQAPNNPQRFYRVSSP